MEMNEKIIAKTIATHLAAVTELVRILDPEFESIHISVSTKRDKKSVFNGKCINVFTMHDEKSGNVDLYFPIGRKFEIYDAKATHKMLMEKYGTQPDDKKEVPDAV